VVAAMGGLVVWVAALAALAARVVLAEAVVLAVAVVVLRGPHDLRTMLPTSCEHKKPWTRLQCPKIV
jgi:hypothetical protein